MSVEVTKQDIRTIKTIDALNVAMFKLLEHQSFGKVTVNKLCNEALISRATFYSYFSDKYNLLESWLVRFEPDNSNQDNAYEQIEEVVNQFVRENKKIIKNLIQDAASETLEILCKHILSIVNIAIEDDKNGDTSPKYIVMSNFYCGGIIYYLTWQIKNKFPSDVPTMNIYFHRALKQLRELE